MTRLLVATESEVIAVDAGPRAPAVSRGLTDQPTCLATDPFTAGRVWCGTRRHGALRSDDGGASWRRTGLDDGHVMALAVSPAQPDLVWVGTEPSALWRSPDGGDTWQELRALQDLPSRPHWSFPPKPETHHVRWIACHPHDADRLWVAIEAGALVFTQDGGRTWRDRVPDGPYDTHELAIHPARPDVLRVAAGDGYFESDDGGATWTSPRDGLEVGYLRSVAIDPGNPDVVVISASRGPHTAYAAGMSDGRLYRREGQGPWARVRDGWPDPPDTIAPLLAAGQRGGELWAADERGVHRSADGGASWRLWSTNPSRVHHLRGLAILR
jgi:hypothetical protein